MHASREDPVYAYAQQAKPSFLPQQNSHIQPRIVNEMCARIGKYVKYLVYLTAIQFMRERIMVVICSGGIDITNVRYVKWLDTVLRYVKRHPEVTESSIYP